MAPRRDLATVIMGRSTLAEAATRYENGGFDIIAGRSGTGSLAHLPPSKLASLRSDLQALAKTYDYVIMDMGAGIERTVRAFANQARTTFVVTTDEPPALTDAYAFIKVTALEHKQADLRVIVNMAKSIRDGERTFGILLKACREFLKFEPTLAGIIRRDAHVREAIRRQVSLLARFPNSEAATDIQAVVDRLLRDS